MRSKDWWKEVQPRRHASHGAAQHTEKPAGRSTPCANYDLRSSITAALGSFGETRK